MEQFSLEKYLANPSRKVVTADGWPVRIICTDAKLDSTEIVGLAMRNDGTECLFTWTKEGEIVFRNGKTLNHLFFAPEKHEGWINIFDNTYPGNMIFDTKEVAEEQGMSFAGYVTTIKIEWNE